MGDLNLTPDERDVVESFARDREGKGSRLWFYASVLVPVLLFAGFGVVRHDFVALLIALLGLAIFVAWRLALEFDHVDLYRSVFRKVAEHERRRE